MGLGRIELPTSRLSGVRSNRSELQAPRTGESIKLRAGCQEEKKRRKRRSKSAMVSAT